MFDQINGLPVHALVLHAAVVFVPLLALGAIVYALIARWRPRIGWAVAAARGRRAGLARSWPRSPARSCTTALVAQGSRARAWRS